jgi:hypothetical protein
MNENVHQNRRRQAVKAAGKVLFVAALVAVAFLVPLPRVDLPDWLALPDLPGWLRFLLGPGKLLVLAGIILLVGLEAADRHRRAGKRDGEDDERASKPPTP